RLDEVSQKRERILAKLKSQVALLERARVALIGMRSGHTQIRAAEMSALSRKFNALASAQGDEARLAHEIATGVELSGHKAEAPAPAPTLASSAQPVSPVSAESDGAPTTPASDAVKS